MILKHFVQEVQGLSSLMKLLVEYLINLLLSYFIIFLLVNCLSFKKDRISIRIASKFKQSGLE